MTLIRMLGFASAVMIAGCTAVPDAGQPQAPRAAPPVQTTNVPRTDPTPPGSGFIPPTVLRAPGLGDVIGKSGSSVTRLFGKPALDTPEGDARKLQFRGEPCILDVFFYPLRPGTEAVATHIEARRASDGASVNRASCVAALRRR